MKNKIEDYSKLETNEKDDLTICLKLPHQTLKYVFKEVFLISGGTTQWLDY